MAKKKSNKLSDKDLDQVEGGTGLPTGKRQHKPFTTTSSTDSADADIKLDGQTITYTGLE